MSCIFVLRMMLRTQKYRHIMGFTTFVKSALYLKNYRCNWKIVLINVVEDKKLGPVLIEYTPRSRNTFRDNRLFLLAKN